MRSARPEAALTATPLPSLRKPWLTAVPRAHRVILLLIVVWMLGMCDLVLTLQEARASYFIEMNPLAAQLIDGPPIGVVIYKLALLGLGSGILVSVRRHRAAEIACWFLLLAKGYVAHRWFEYFDGLTKITPLVYEFGP
jgi:hypothetical protein